ncbi:MAG: 50S ribosomal protein L35 [Microgenomates group bacterium GW2011_GWC1_41_8]|nr:MAG: 50S ribosomal protein L35 [Microgenomates group bacterium GW2011_GWC1_41_8]
MVKQKTNKSILSRLKISGKGKLIRRATNQSHFNAKDSGKKGRLKHKSALIKKSDKKLFKQYIPYA